MIFSGQDPRVKHRREEEEYRRQQYEQAMREITVREDRLLARIEEQQVIVEKRREEIDERAIKLHDGRRAYVDGDGYVDGQGRELSGADYDEAHRLHQQNPDAATRQENAENNRQANDLETLRQNLQQHQQDREQAGAPVDLKQEQQTADDYEKRFKQAAEPRRAEIEKKADSVADAYGTDYMADLGRTTSYAKQQAGEGKTLAADFTPAAEGKIDLSKIQIEGVIVKVVKDKFPPQK